MGFTIGAWFLAARSKIVQLLRWAVRGRRLGLFGLATIAVLGLHQFRVWNLPTVSLPTSSADALSSRYQSNVRLGDKTVALGGGGAVTGIYFHPRQKDLVYIRTDVGGFFRWNPQTQSWISISDSFSLAQLNYFGGESLALDPNHPDRVYIAVGKSHWFGPGTLLRSDDRGTTWQRLNLELPLAEDYRRWVGERLAVNPFNSQQLLFGSWKNGLWRSTDAGTSWQPVKTFEAREANVSAIVFDPRTQGRVFAYAEGQGISESVDGGLTWQPSPNSPKAVMRMAIASDGTLYSVGFEAPQVAKLSNGTWQDISPPDSDPVFSAITLNPRNPQEVLVSRGEKANPEMYRSLDAGRTWKILDRTTTSTVPWWPKHMKELAWIAAMEFDPHQSGQVWLTDWYGIWRTQKIDAQPVAWTNLQTGHEQVVVFTLVSPPQGPLLLSGMADVDGFWHNNGLDAYPSRDFGQTGPRFQDTYSIAYCETDPRQLVRVGGRRWEGATQSGAVSSDGGKTWQEFPAFPPDRVPTRVAMSATDHQSFVVTTSKAQPIVTHDSGRTWKPVQGLPDGAKGPWNLPPQSLVADSRNGDGFYYYADGKVYRSDDRGDTFSEVSANLPGVDWHTLQSMPGTNGELWLGLDEEGLFRSTDQGRSFTRLPKVERAYLFDIGAAKPGSDRPTLYLYGKISGLGEGIFRSLDQGQTWSRINDPQKPIGNAPSVLEASRQVFGLVFVGTGGRGIYYGSAE